ncbi:DNA helicase [Streptomyces albus]|uniref:DNA helicase n=2 Tax=Streptomyces TaxID=1883 RepID=A0A0B5EQE6_STRA4|nr:DNA helicase [Streptomyces albus]AOU74697.1 DNA helicase [Streptomyces albus]AYN30508.1 DNA helicase [Streptomyces albus]
MLPGMSLTSCLENSSSAMSRFMAEHLPLPKAVVSDFRQRLKNFPEPVKPDAGPGQRPEYQMLGHTIDHRLRISLGAPTGRPIKEGVVRACSDYDGWPSSEVIHAVQTAGQVLLEELRTYQSPDGQPLALGNESEERLVRLCHVASSFEVIFRCGGWVPGNRLGLCRPADGLDDLVAAVPDYIVHDIRSHRLTTARLYRQVETLWNLTNR